YMGARYYDPAIGRFMGIDAVGFQADNPVSFNRYAYANNNPYKYVDPDGNAAFLIPLVVMVAKEVAAEGFERATGMPALFSGKGAAKFLSKKLLKKEGKDATKGGLPDNAIVCRGGSCTADRFTSGSGVTTDAAGKLDGVSVNSAPGKSLQELTQGIPHKKVGVTTVGDVRRAGGDVVASPTKNNPNHATLSGITAKQAENLMTPTMKNPNR
ncbi:RHS repeat-associated core domain-containing protein, partial [Exilibacterium tricleocarpae]|uniref:RHS repeat-associated core domain-containing protein n=1 Tax=Exilibacterium tricleocarpae TaxID=2591008 RepID=UPI001C550FBE